MYFCRLIMRYINYTFKLDKTQAYFQSLYCATCFDPYFSHPQAYQYKTLINEDLIKSKGPRVYSHYFINLKQYKL